MPDFFARYEKQKLVAPSTRRFFGYSRDEAVRRAKKIGDEVGAKRIYITYAGSGKTVGYWEKKGSRWYKE